VALGRNASWTDLRNEANSGVGGRGPGAGGAGVRPVALGRNASWTDLRNEANSGVGGWGPGAGEGGSEGGP
jgi:hypothetical protein